ncbi:MAG: ABC transporter permease [Planctomycetales bacterium]|nr:ABC transporter permease [Planctomycetales bacterium]
MIAGNPIIQRELIGTLRLPRALALQLGPALLLMLLVYLRWPSDAEVDSSGAAAHSLFSLLAYTLLAMVLLLAPIFPATSLVRERRQGTLTLLFNSNLSSLQIYFGKFAAMLLLALLPLVASLPAAAACYALGGVNPSGLVTLYAILTLDVACFTALALLVSLLSSTSDAALRITYGLVLLLAIVSLGPFQILQGSPQPLLESAASLIRSLSPIPAIMEIVGHGDIGSQGLQREGGELLRHLIVEGLATILFAAATIWQLRPTLLDRSRWQGVMTEDRAVGERRMRRMFFLVDPQRRSKAIPSFVNPVLIKEFRSRRLGRSHWVLRLIAGCAVLSLLLTFATTSSTLAWGVETIGGILVIMQGALITLVTPSLAAGLISGEHESGGWNLLRMTPITTWRVVTGKLLSVLWILLLILAATLPGYSIMMWIKPVLQEQIIQVLICLSLWSVFTLLLSAAVSSFFQRTAPATVTVYGLLIAMLGGTAIVWILRDAPFGHALVERVLLFNPLAAALSVIEMPGFAEYRLLPESWHISAVASVTAFLILVLQTWRLTRPQ